MPRPTQIPLSRGAAHLSARRFAEAAGAFRAALHIDPREVRAMLGLADCALARGERRTAYDHLVEAGRTCVELDQPGRALDLFTRAIRLEPDGLEVHLDVAEAELALDRTASALARLESLAAAYVERGRADDAAEVMSFVAGVAASSSEPPRSEPPRSETVVCTTMLITPDGKPFVPRPAPPQKTAPARTFAPKPTGPRVVVRSTGVPTTVAPQHTESIARRGSTTAPPAARTPAAKPPSAKPTGAKPQPLPQSDIAARLRKQAGLPRPAAPTAAKTPPPAPSRVATAPHRIATPPRAKVEPAPRPAPREDLDDQRTRLYRLPTIPPAAPA